MSDLCYLGKTLISKELKTLYQKQERNKIEITKNCSLNNFRNRFYILNIFNSKVSKRSTIRNLQCECKLAKSSVAAKLFVTPNMIDFKNVWKKFAGLADNMAVLGTILAVLIIFTILIVCFRRYLIRF